MKYTTQKSISLLEALFILSPQSSKNNLRSWIKEGRVQVDGKSVKIASFVLEVGQTVTIGQKIKLIDSKIPIIYEDADLIIVDKPAGLLSVSTAFQKQKTMHAILKNYYKPRKVFIVHRLDQETSGAMVFALNQTSFERLKKTFETHSIERSYTAIVEGHPQPLQGTWESYQYEDANYTVHETQDQSKGRIAITHYQTKKTNKRYSCLQLILETGRKNQIRVHCQSAGCPVVGDKKYGLQTNPIKRLALHAQFLAFQHPITHQMLTFESPLPDSFHRLFPEKK